MKWQQWLYFFLAFQILFHLIWIFNWPKLSKPFLMNTVLSSVFSLSLSLYFFSLNCSYTITLTTYYVDRVSSWLSHANTKIISSSSLLVCIYKTNRIESNWYTQYTHKKSDHNHIQMTTYASVYRYIIIGDTGMLLNNCSFFRLLSIRFIFSLLVYFDLWIYNCCCSCIARLTCLHTLLGHVLFLLFSSFSSITGCLFGVYIYVWLFISLINFFVR